MKNKKGRPRNNDDSILLDIARKIKADSKITVRSAIVQCLPVITDSNIRRLQRKWRTEGASYLNRVDDQRSRSIDRTQIGIPRSYFTMAQEIRASLDSVTAPMRQMQEAIDRMNAPFRQMQEIISSNPAILSAKRLAEALKPSGLELALEQFKRLDLGSVMPDTSALQAMTSMDLMTKNLRIGVIR